MCQAFVASVLLKRTQRPRYETRLEPSLTAIGVTVVPAVAHGLHVPSASCARTRNR